MGLHHQLPTDSIPLLLIVTAISHLRSVFHSITNILHRNRRRTFVVPNNLFTSNLVLLADQLNKNRIFSHKYGESENDSAGGDCVVCICKLREGDQVRRFPCCHVFHKSCFDGWLDHLNFNCPLCRSTTASSCLLYIMSVDQSTI